MSVLVYFVVEPLAAAPISDCDVPLGAITTAVGIGAALSQMIAGTIVHHYSFNAGFLFLAAVATIAFSILCFFMPETREKRFLNESV
jgi:MFS family permease